MLTALLLSCGVPQTPPEAEPGLPTIVDMVDAGQPRATDAGMHTGFPCEVRTVLQNSCAGCHSSTSYAVHFKSRGDFHVEIEGERFGSIVVRRMNATPSPMPPDGPLPANARAVISDWVNAGMPAGECADLSE